MMTTEVPQFGIVVRNGAGKADMEAQAGGGGSYDSERPKQGVGAAPILSAWF
jgi:hypothetical protein